MRLPKYSMGTGDRFGLQAGAQLSAIMDAQKKGIDLAIVWNKSNREHQIIKTSPEDVRKAAEDAVAAAGYRGKYYCDADHINLETVDAFIDSSDFFTLDVADWTGKQAAKADIEAFTGKYHSFVGLFTLPGINTIIDIAESDIRESAEKYLMAVQEAGKIYRKIEKAKGTGNFITEVSMDETDLPQTPVEMLFILAAISDEGIPAQTIAPKFTGRFNKGVDYVGDLTVFEKEFSEDLAVIEYAVKNFSLPKNLKLSVHSGSDKFSIYPIINKLIKAQNAGLHLKTAGTTWLEELIGLAEAGGNGLSIAKRVYQESFKRFDELCGPYATVIDIDKTKLPDPREVNSWSSDQYTSALRHDLNCPDYNLHVRQMLHVGYKVAAEMGDEYLNALKADEEHVARNVKLNIFERHLQLIFA